ncbi:hypothetical protein C5C64_15750, partial [Rathayibacter sp. AY1D3]
MGRPRRRRHAPAVDPREPPRLPLGADALPGQHRRSRLLRHPQPRLLLGRGARRRVRLPLRARALRRRRRRHGLRGDRGLRRERHGPLARRLPGRRGRRRSRLGSDRRDPLGRLRRLRPTPPGPPAVPEQLPVRRTYTVRSVDLERRSIAVDFVVHG